MCLYAYMDAVSCRTASFSANLGTRCKFTSKWPLEDYNYRVFFLGVIENRVILILDCKNSEWALFFV
jgi:hypothetical protein